MYGKTETTAELFYPSTEYFAENFPSFDTRRAFSSFLRFLPLHTLFGSYYMDLVVSCVRGWDWSQQTTSSKVMCKVCVFALIGGRKGGISVYDVVDAVGWLPEEDVSPKYKYKNPTCLCCW